LKVTGSAQVEATNVSDTNLTFTQADVTAGTVKTVETQDIAETLVTSLLGNLNLSVQLFGIPLAPVNVIKTLVNSILAAVAAPLDNLVSTLLSLLGVHLGEADIQVHGIRCGGSVLAG
jgi:uncharacterized membrane protein